MSPQLSFPWKQAALLLDFQYGDEDSPTYLRLTNFTSVLVYDGNTYTAAPELDVTFPPFGGTLKDEICDVVAKISIDTLFDDLTSGYRHSKVTLTITEVLFEREDDLEPEIVYVGELDKGFRNYQGKPEQVKFEFTTIKNELESALGLVAGHHCVWQPFERGCELDIADFTDSGTITDIDGKTITITGLGAQTGKYYHRGSVKYDGLEMMVRDWDASAPTIFEMGAEPPPSWLGKTVDVIAGDDRTIDTCRNRFGNENRFTAIGYGIPAHNPQIENPA